jgi:hypothetical protein
MIKVKMPFYFRMQNFMFIKGEIFWTSATKTLWQKIKVLLKKEDGNYCNTSGGFTMIGHGQDVFYNGYFIVVTENDGRYVYDELIGNSLLCRLNEKPTPKTNIQGLLQGFAFHVGKEEYTHAVFGAASKEPIKVYDIKTNDEIVSLNYNDHKKWWWKYWEAEGIQWHEGKLYVGISVKSKFGFICNYIKEVK